MRRPEAKEPLAQITFNEAAARQYFGESSKGVRLRIEQGVVTFRPLKNMRGADVIAIERRPRRGISVEITQGQASKRLMTRLFRAGLSEEQPYFALEPVGRGTFAIDHLDAPQGGPTMVVSNFETPPPPIDIALWRRFLRTIKNQKPVDVALWTDVLRMIRGAAQITRRPQRSRASQERLSAESLFSALKKNVPHLFAWCERQPEYGNDVTALCSELGIDLEPGAVSNVVPIVRRRRATVSRVSRPVSPDQVRQVLGETESEKPWSSGDQVAERIAAEDWLAGTETTEPDAEPVEEDTDTMDEPDAMDESDATDEPVDEEATGTTDRPENDNHMAESDPAELDKD